MTTQAAPADLLVTWKTMYDQAEKLWTKPLQEMLGTETVVKLMSATRENVLSQQQVSRETLEKQWDALRLPTKTDHARLASQVIALESKVEAVEDRLEALEGKLDRIVGLLEAMAPAAPDVRAAGAEEVDPENGKRRRK